MSMLDNLLDGVEVEWKTMKEISHSITTGLNPRKNFKLNDGNDDELSVWYITTKDYSRSEKIEFINGKTAKITKKAKEIINKRSKLEKGDILFSAVGTVGKIAFIDIDTQNFDINESTFAIKPKVDVVIPLFLVYYLRSDIVQKVIKNNLKGSTLSGIRKGTLLNFKIPIPCPDNPEKSLKIQKEIVRILDTFTELTSELIAELTARKKQYEYYREQLLTFEDGEVEWKPLGEVGKIKRGVAFTKKQAVLGEFPVVANADAPIIFHNEFNRDGEFVVIARSGANAGLVSYWNEKLFLTDAFSIHPNNSILNTKFAFYFLKKNQKKIHSMKRGSGVPHVRASDFEIYKFPILPIEEQQHIVNILDKFDALTTSSSEGLPKEIELRKKQYEYYRNKLLTFPKDTVEV